MFRQGFSGCASGKGHDCQYGDLGSIPGSGQFPWERAWQPTSVFLENLMDRGDFQATSHRVTKSST